MKPRAKFAMFFLSAAVLAGAWLLMGYMAADPAEETAVAEADGQETVDISVGGYRELTALSWSWDGDTVNLERSPETGRWVNADDGACPIDDAAAESLAKAAAGTAVSMAISGVTDLAQYGLDAPALTVIAATEDAMAGYEIGNKSITGEYYLRRSGDDTVYLENGSLSAFRLGIGDVLALEHMPGDIAAVTGLEVQSAAEEYALAYLETDEPGWYRIDGEEPVPLEEERVRALYETLTDLALTDCVTWNAVDSEEYGLKAPQAVAVLRYIDGAGKELTATVEFGDYAGGDVYARFAGSDMVYRVPGAVPDALMYPRWETMMPMTVMNLDVGSIAQVRVGLSGQAYEIARLEETVERPVGDETVSVTDVIYSMNGWVLDTDPMEKWLAALAGLPAEGLAPAGEGRQTILSVTITWKDGESVPAELELRDYDSVHDLCVIGGDRYLLVPRDKAEELVGSAESLFKTE